MAGVIASLLLALRQLANPAVLRIVLKSVGLTLVFTLLIAWGGWHALDWALRWAGLGDALFTGAEETRGAVSLLLSLIGIWLTWRIVAMVVIQFFADEVVAAVEGQSYPGAAKTARDLPVAEQLRLGLRAGLRALLVNVAILPLALVLLVTGIGTALLFWGVNAVLLGLELQEMVRQRHCTRGTDAAGKACWVPVVPDMTGFERFALGGVVAAMLMVPFVNFLAPVLGAAGATHVIHRKGMR